MRHHEHDQSGRKQNLGGTVEGMESEVEQEHSQQMGRGGKTME